MSNAAKLPSTRVNKKYLVADLNQLLLLPPDIREWVPENHFSQWLLHIGENLELRAFYDHHEVREDPAHGGAGRPPIDPKMMLLLMFYGMFKGQFSSRAMEAFVQTDLGARLIVGGTILPDHSSFANFRKRHRENLKDAFVEVLMLCVAAGKVDLKHVSLDGTKFEANASRHNSVKVSEMQKLHQECLAEIEELLKKLESADAEEAQKLKRSKRKAMAKKSRLEEAIDYLDRKRKSGQVAGASEQPSETDTSTSADWDDAQQTEGLLEMDSQNGPDLGDAPPVDRAEAVQAAHDEIAKKIKKARGALGMTQAALAKEVGISRPHICKYEKGKSCPSPESLGKLASVLSLNIKDLLKLHNVIFPAPVKNDGPAMPGTINLTDPDAYFLFHKHKGYMLGYLPQLAVDGKSQIILTVGMARSSYEQPFLPESIDTIHSLFGEYPEKLSVDAGFWDIDGQEIEAAAKLGIDMYCPPKGKAPKSDENVHPNTAKMRTKLSTPEGKATYNRRSQIVEPVNARLKSLIGNAKLRTRGVLGVVAEVMEVSILHNLLKLFQGSFK